MSMVAEEQKVSMESKSMQPSWILYDNQKKRSVFPALSELIETMRSQNTKDEFPFFVTQDEFEKLTVFLTKRPRNYKDEDPNKFALTLCKALLIRAINFLRRNDARERLSKTPSKIDLSDVALHEFGLDELYEYYDEFVGSHEGLYYGLERYYRDHVRHPLYVWLIGMRVLLSLFSEKIFQYKKDFDFLSVGRENIQILPRIREQKKFWNKNSSKLKIWAGELTAMWTIIALTHDLGYPFERFERLNQKGQGLFGKVKGINLSPVTIVFSQQHASETIHFLEIISSKIQTVADDDKILDNGKSAQKRKPRWLTRVRPKYYHKFAKSLASQKHGILSAWLLTWFTSYFTEIYISKRGDSGEGDPEEARQFAIRAEILAAISSHTTDLIYHINPFTLSFLLILCDELQEWGRPTLQEMQNQQYSGFAERVELEPPKKQDNGWILKAKLTYSLPLKHKGRPRSTEMREKLFTFHKEFALGRAKAWYKRLRPAIGDTGRNLQFIWEMKIISDSPKIAALWSFEFDSMVPETEDIRVNLFGPCKEWYVNTNRESMNRKAFPLYQ